MATYKVIQDIEAEDKLIGPLTLRQSIYAAVAVLCGFLAFQALTRNLAFFLPILVPPMLFTAFFAIPWGGDQSTEVWALAKIRFLIKSRKRLWDQTGAKELVTITAPKHEVKNRSNGLSANEVQSRLTALASTLDTRGWAVKNVYSIPPLAVQQSSDRLIDVDSLPQQVPTTGITAADDMLDAANNPRAHQLQEMVTAASASHKQELLEHMQHGDLSALPTPVMQAATNQWFMNSPVSMPAAGQPALDNAPDAVVSEELHEHLKNAGNEHLKTIQPLSAKTKPRHAPVAAATVPTPPPTVTPTPDPATIHLSQRDDLNISTIARIAKGEDSGNEVVIPLH